jgi:hypothetical protein
MELTLKITRNGSSYEVATDLFVIVSWERKYKAKASDLVNGVAIEHLAYMAYECSKRDGIEVPVVFDDFLKSLTGLEISTNDAPKVTRPEAIDEN